MVQITTDEYQQRRQKVRTAMEAEGLDALIAYSTAKVQANVRYLTSYFVRFTGMQTRPDGSYYMFGACSALLPLDGEPVVRTDQPWDVARAKEMSLFDDTDYATRFADDFGPLCRAQGYRRVGIDNWYLFPAHEYLALKEQAPDTEFVPTRLLADVRRIKSPAEIDTMRQAGRLAVEAVSAALDVVKAGVTEYEVVLVCEAKMREKGELELGGQSIAGCGANTATGSSVPSSSPRFNKTMEPGEWYLLDVCPRVDGYCADISRHALAGDFSDLDPRLRKLYDTTVLMNEEVRKAIKPGVTGLQMNELARQVAADQGLEQYKIGLLGHGVGLDIHDVPDYYFDDTPWSAGEVVTVEPSLLMPGLGGTRVEDLVLVTDTGSEVLTDMPRELAGS